MILNNPYIRDFIGRYSIVTYYVMKEDRPDLLELGVSGQDEFGNSDSDGCSIVNKLNKGVVESGKSDRDVPSAQYGDVILRGTKLNTNSGSQEVDVRKILNPVTPEKGVNVDSLVRTCDDLSWMGCIGDKNSGSRDFIFRIHCLRYVLRYVTGYHYIHGRMATKKVACLDHNANCLRKVLDLMIAKADFGVDYFGKAKMTELNSSFYLKLIEIDRSIPMKELKSVAKVLVHIANMEMGTLDIEIVGRNIGNKEGLKLVYGIKIHGLATEATKFDNIMHVIKSTEGGEEDFSQRSMNIDNETVAEWVNEYADDYESTFKGVNDGKRFCFEDNKGNIDKIRGIAKAIGQSEYNFHHLKCTARQDKFGGDHGIQTVNLVTNIVVNLGEFVKSRVIFDLQANDYVVVRDY